MRGHGAVQIISDFILIQRIERVGKAANRQIAEASGIRFLRKPGSNSGGRIKLANHMQHALGGEKFALHERAQIGGNTLLVGRDDRGMRNEAQPERMAKQRHHSEPICQRANHRRFGKCSNVRQPCQRRMTGFEIGGQREHQRCRQQQAIGQPLHVPQPAALVGVLRSSGLPRLFARCHDASSDFSHCKLYGGIIKNHSIVHIFIAVF